MQQFLIPLLFVVVWSTGFIIARAAAPHADLQLFLFLRFLASAVILGIVAAASKAAWPSGRQWAAHVMVGALMLGVYLTCSYWAVSQGLPAGIMSLLGALQPLCTALILVTFAHQRLQARTWAGLGVGLGGVALVLAPKLAAGAAGALTWTTVAAALVSVLAVTTGTLMQKRLSSTSIWSAASAQNFGAAIVALIAMWSIGNAHWDGSISLWAALLWAVIGTSVLASTLLVWMVRHGEATKVTALMLLVPPLAALQAYFLFRETLSPMQLIGFALALGGVLLARSGG
ncbi:MAG TPA: DMT family transporter [Steroidobacteraceae bacterium]|nr:DMT family transporter [Steroidobacteraceae bacterium]